MARFISKVAGWSVITCPSCKCNIEYETSEVKTEGCGLEGLGGWHEWRSFIECPVCDREIEVQG